MSEGQSQSVQTQPAARPRRLQERGVLRHNQLLDAAHDLLMDHELEELGLYQIAKRAGIPPGSAYHFFPSVDAVLLALAERYHSKFFEIGSELGSYHVTSWQEVLKYQLQSSVSFYNENLPIRKVFLSGHTTRELVITDRSFNERVAYRMSELYATLFHMPFIRDIAEKFLVAVTLTDSVWSLSFARHRTITPAFEQEAITVSIAYCRTFLPEFMELRNPQQRSE